MSKLCLVQYGEIRRWSLVGVTLLNYQYVVGKWGRNLHWDCYFLLMLLILFYGLLLQAAHYFNMKLIRVPLDKKTLKCDMKVNYMAIRLFVCLPSSFGQFHNVSFFVYTGYEESNHKEHCCGKPSMCFIFFFLSLLLSLLSFFHSHHLSSHYWTFLLSLSNPYTPFPSIHPSILFLFPCSCSSSFNSSMLLLFFFSWHSQSPSIHPSILLSFLLFPFHIQLTHLISHTPSSSPFFLLPSLSNLPAVWGCDLYTDAYCIYIGIATLAVCIRHRVLAPILHNMYIYFLLYHISQYCAQ